MSETTTPPAAPASDPISATVTRVTKQTDRLPEERPSEAAMRLSAAGRKPLSKGERHAKLAQDAFARANGLPIAARGDSIAERVAASGIATKKGQRGPTARKGTSVTKTKTTKKTAKTSAKKSAPAKKPTLNTATSAGLPAKVASIVNAFTKNDETRYARKVWKYLTKQRTSAPAKYGLTPERAAAIYEKVEAAV